MPHNASAAKRLRQNEQRRLRNKARLTELKTLAKKAERAAHDGEVEKAAELVRQFGKRSDQAASLRVVHANAVDRSKSRLVKRVAKQNIATAQAAADKKASPSAKPVK